MIDAQLKREVLLSLHQKGKTFTDVRPPNNVRRYNKLYLFRMGLVLGWKMDELQLNNIEL